MKTTLQALGMSMLGMVIMVACMLCWTPARADSVYNIDLATTTPDTNFFELDGQFTTHDNVVTTISGIFSDDFELWRPVSIDTVGLSIDDFTYDNVFYGGSVAAGWFDNAGLLFNAGLSDVNLYSDSGTLFFYDDHNGFIDFGPINGTITLDHTTSVVPELPSLWMVAIGWFIIETMLRRRRKQ